MDKVKSAGRSVFKEGFKEPLRRLDFLNTNVPTFNLGGEYSIRTISGGCMSILITCATIWFALAKLQHLLIRKSPVITTFVD